MVDGLTADAGGTRDWGERWFSWTTIFPIPLSRGRLVVCDRVETAKNQRGARLPSRRVPPGGFPYWASRHRGHLNPTSGGTRGESANVGRGGICPCENV